MVPGRAASLGLTAEPPTLAPGSSSFKLYVKAAGGPSGLSGRTVLVDADGATAAGPARDLGSGDYEQSFSATGDGTINLAVGLASAATGNPFNRLLVLPLSESVAADSRSPQRLAVIAVDANGYPVANVPVDLKVTSGDGAVTQSVNTGANGIAFATYTAGTASGFTVVKGTSGGKVGEAGFIQANGTVAALNAPVTGSAATAALTSAWAGSVGQLSVARTGGVMVAAAPVAATAAPCSASSIRSARSDCLRAATSEPSSDTWALVAHVLMICAGVARRSSASRWRAACSLSRCCCISAV